MARLTGVVIFVRVGKSNGNLKNMNLLLLMKNCMRSYISTENMCCAMRSMYVLYTNGLIFSLLFVIVGRSIYQSKCNCITFGLLQISSGGPNQIYRIPKLQFGIIRFGIFRKYRTEYLQGKTELKTDLRSHEKNDCSYLYNVV